MADKYSADREKLEALLDISSTRVQQNTEVVTPDDMPRNLPYQLHISTNTNIRKFIPKLTLRGAESENRDITRICTAPTLLGCIIGYASLTNDVLTNASDGKEDNDGFKGGWKIYALPFKACLKPNTKMVYDFKYSDEHWLVSYSDETREYVPETAGRFFVQRLSHVTRTGKMVTEEITLLVEVVLDCGIPFGKKHWLDKGYWRIEGPGVATVESWKTDDAYKVVSISKGEYEAAKKVHADLLSYQEPSLQSKKPAFLNWE